LSDRRTREHDCKDIEHLLKFMAFNHSHPLVTSHKVVHVMHTLTQSQPAHSLHYVEATSSASNTKK
jgi:hypothetical protein